MLLRPYSSFWKPLVPERPVAPVLFPVRFKHQLDRSGRVGFLGFRKFCCGF